MAGQEDWDVFISHCGVDTKRRGFSVWLNRELTRLHFTSFFNERSLQSGDQAWAIIMDALSRAKVVVIVLSQGFFRSKHCMRELHQCRVQRKTMLPIFLDVAPDQCRPEALREGRDGDRDGSDWEVDVDWITSITGLRLEALGGFPDVCIETVQAVARLLGRPAVVPVDLTPFLRNPDFVGRAEELETLEKLLSEHGRAFVTGHRGSGKTELLVEYVYRHRGSFAKILWIDGASQNRLENFVGLAEHLGVALAEGSDAGAENCRRVKGALERAEAPFLLVMDNVDNDEAGLWDMLPRHGLCQVLISTSMNALGSVKGFRLKEHYKQEVLRTEKGSNLPLSLGEAAARLMAAAKSFDGHADLWGLSLGHLPLDNFENLRALVSGLRSLNLSNTALIDEGSYKGPPPLAHTSYQGLLALAKLSNLHTLILANNRLTSLPAELGQLQKLTHLDISNNQLTALPQSVGGMSALVHLLLGGNVGLRVTPDWLPASCPGIEELGLEACGFSTLPLPLLRLPVLRTLWVGCNEPGMTLPCSMEDALTGHLYVGGLEVLSLSSLALVDEDLSCLKSLKQLTTVDLQDNRLVSVPHFLFELGGLQSLELAGNDGLVTPPREVVRHGLPAMKEFMRALADGRVRRTIVRIMFVGYAEAGKTKLNYALQKRMAEWKPGSTIGIDTAKWAVDWAGSDLKDRVEFRSWDFAGQKEYYAMHRIFLTDRAIYLFLVDLSTPQPGEGSFRERLQETVRFWLDSLRRRTNRALVRVVATKVDRLEAGVVTERLQVLLELLNEERCFRSAKLVDERPGAAAVEPREGLVLPTSVDEIFLSSLSQDPVANAVDDAELGGSEANELPEALRFWGTWGLAGNMGRETKNATLQPQEPMDSVLEVNGSQNEGALAPSEDYLNRIRSELVELAKEECFQIELPASYVRLMAAVEKMRFGAEVVPFMDREAFRREMLVPAGLKSKESAAVAVTLLHELGILLWFKPRQGSSDAQVAAELSERVFLDPQWVIDLLKPILSHSDENQFLPPSDDPTEWGSYWAREYASDVRGAHQHRLNLVKLLKEKGILHHELLDLIPNAQQAPARAGIPRPSVQLNVLDLLERYGLAYQVTPFPEGYHFVPTRCKEQPPSNLHPVLFPVSSESGPIKLSGMRLTFVSARRGGLPQLPEGFAESVIVGFHSLVTSIPHHKSRVGPGSVPGIIEQWEHGSLFRELLSGVRAAILVNSPHVGPNMPRNRLEIMCSLKLVMGDYNDRVRAHIYETFTSFCSLRISALVTEMSPGLQPNVEVLVKGSQQGISDTRFPGFGWEESDFSLRPRWKGLYPDGGGTSHFVDQDSKAVGTGFGASGSESIGASGRASLDRPVPVPLSRRRQEQQASVGDGGVTPEVRSQEVTLYETVNWEHLVFISHAGPSKDLADDIQNELRNLRITAFLDKLDLHPGDDADSKMITQAQKSPIGLVLLSEEFLKRKWPMLELKLIVEKESLLPVLVGMSYTEFEDKWKKSQEGPGIDADFVRKVRRTTCLIDEKGERVNLRQNICLAVVRVLVEKVCPRLPNVAHSMNHVYTARKAARKITDKHFSKLLGNDFVEAASWVTHLEQLQRNPAYWGTRFCRSFSLD